MFLFFKDTIRGMGRRRKEIRLLVAVEFAVIAFISAALLFQENSERFNFENGRNYYGDWVIAEVITNEQIGPQLTNHSYFDSCGTVKSGIKISGKNGKQIGSAVGTMDDTFLEIGKITLREGRFPEKDDEIAMEASLLMELGLPLDTGQEITLEIVHDDGSSESRSFLLVGVMKKSAGLWCIGSVMPMAVITEEAIKQIDFTPVSIYCYRLSKTYKDVDTFELYENLAEKYTDLQSDGWNLAYNEYLYATSFWGTPEFYNFLKKLVLIMGIAALSFLLAAYIQKRKRYYYNLRVIGITRLKVKQTILWESLCFGVLGGSLALAAAILSGAAISFFLSVTKGIAYFYEVSAEFLFDVFFSWVSVFVGSTLIAMVSTGRKRLYENTHIVSVKPLFKKRLNRLKPKRRYSGIFIREHRVFWVRNLFGGLVCIVFSGLIMLCGAKIWEGWYNFNTVCKFRWDIVGTKIAEEPAEKAEYVWEHEILGVTGTQSCEYGKKQLTNGYSQSFFELFDQINGIKSCQFSTYDDAHLFEWKNMETDPYVQIFLDSERGNVSVVRDGAVIEDAYTMRDVIDKNSLAFGYEGWYVSNTKETFDRYNEKYGNGSMDYEAFVNGEQVFVIIHDVGSYINEGSVFSILAGEEKVEVTAGCVILSNQIGFDFARFVPVYSEGEGMYSPVFFIIGSENLGRKIAACEGREYGYNRAALNLDLFANYNTTVKQCMQLFSGENADITSWYEQKQMFFSEFLTKSILYGSFIVMLFAFFIMIRCNLIQAGFTFQGSRMKRLRLLGMSKKEIRRMYLLQGLYESMWIWLAILPTYAIRIKEIYENYRENERQGIKMSLYVEKLQIYVSDMWNVIRYSIDVYVNIWVCIGILVIIAAVIVVTRYVVVKCSLHSIVESI